MAAAALCVGCGLTTDDDGRLIANGGEWGVGALNFPCDDSNGAAVYCDSKGKLRTVPDHDSVLIDINEPTDVSVTIASGDEHYSPTTITYTNPSPCRTMHFMAVAQSQFQITANPGSTWRFRSGGPVTNTPSGAGTTIARDAWGTGTGFVAKVVEAQGIVNDTLSLAPGASLTVTTGLTTQCLGGTISLTRHGYVVTAIGTTT